MNRYDYKELREKAITGTADDVNELGEWFQHYGMSCWNGEYFDADGYKVTPIYGKEDEAGCFPLLGYEMDLM